VDRAHLEERFTSSKLSIGTLREDISEKDLRGMEENDRRRNWERPGLGPEHDPLEVLHGSPVLLKGQKKISC
jgi:hypothetical protein